MGVLGRYLDLLPPEARARIQTATRWTTRWHVDESGARNLLGHAEDWTWPDRASAPQCGAPELFRLRAAAGDELWTDEPFISRRFDRLVQKRGMDRTVELVCGRLRKDVTLKRILPRRGHLTLIV